MWRDGPQKGRSGNLDGIGKVAGQNITMDLSFKFLNGDFNAETRVDPKVFT